MELNYKVIRRLTIAVLAVFIVSICAFFAPSDALTYNGLQVKYPEVSEPSQGDIFVMVQGTFGSDSSTAVLAKINGLRKEACDNGYPDPRTGGTTRLKSSDYVPLKWSTNLEKSAKLRAAEASIYLTHTRPGIGMFGAYYGTSPDNESLAWGYKGSLGGVQGWAYEKPDWINKNWDEMTVHYEMLINPDYRAVGVGSFVRPGFSYRTTIAAELSFDDSGSQAQDNLDGKVVQMIEVNPYNYKIKGTTLPKVISVGTDATAVTTASTYGPKGEYIGDYRVFGSLDWMSSNPSVATVDNRGVVHGVSAGKTTITGTIKEYDGTTIYEFKTTVAVTNINRLYGKSRYDTSIAAADELKKTLGKEKFSNIIVATGDNYPDALTGAYLSKVKNAPIILVNSSSESRITDYIKKNLASDGKVYILGGTGVVSENFESVIKKNGYSVSRLDGSNRYETNIAILKEAGVKSDDLLVCTGEGFADSLSASAVGKPILLVAKAGLNEDQKEYLADIKIQDVYLIGGEGVVSNEVGKSFASYDKNGACERVAGANRYTTSTEIANRFFGKNPTKVVLAYAQTFPDGLSGGPLALSIGSPLILTDNANFGLSREYTSKTTISDGYVLGGPTLISDEVAAILTNQID